MRTRAVTITLRLVVPDSPDLDERVNSLDEPPLTMLEDVLHGAAEEAMLEALRTLREILMTDVQAIAQTHVVGAPFDDSEDW